MLPTFSAHILAFNPKKQILLVKRRDVPIWVIPGGKAEKSETPAQTAIREFYEETGIRVPEKKIRLAAHYTPSKQNGRSKYTFVTHLTTEQPIPTDESSSGKFFSPQTLPEPISVYEEQRIREAMYPTSSKPLHKVDKVFLGKEFRKLGTNPFLLCKLFFLYIKARYGKKK